VREQILGVTEVSDGRMPELAMAETLLEPSEMDESLRFSKLIC
jgi:hypothetical protein